MDILVHVPHGTNQHNSLGAQAVKKRRNRGREKVRYLSGIQVWEHNSHRCSISKVLSFAQRSLYYSMMVLAAVSPWLPACVPLLGAHRHEWVPPHHC